VFSRVCLKIWYVSNTRRCFCAKAGYYLMHIPYEVFCELLKSKREHETLMSRYGVDVHAREGMSLPRSHAEARHRDKSQRAGNVISHPRIIRHVNPVLQTHVSTPVTRDVCSAAPTKHLPCKVVARPVRTGCRGRTAGRSLGGP